MAKQIKKETPIQDIYRNICENGYFEFQNPVISKRDYKKLYHCFDNLISLITQDQSVHHAISNTEKDFLSLYGATFCGSPSGYRDCTQKLGKKDQKQYFQYSREYNELFKTKYNVMLEKFDFFRLFLDYLEKIEEQASTLLETAIDRLEKDITGLKQAFFSGRNELTVVTKIIRYQGNGQLCTSPHYDKSGLTLVLDNDDTHNDRFVMGSYSDPFEPTSLSPPKQSKLLYKTATSAYLFPWACLKKVGFPLNPTPHAVLPAKTSFRHSIIAFCLIPNLETKDIQTAIMDKKQFLSARSQDFNEI